MKLAQVMDDFARISGENPRQGGLPLHTIMCMPRSFTSRGSGSDAVGSMQHWSYYLILRTFRQEGFDVGSTQIQPIHQGLGRGACGMR